nr:hypothetical protein [Tanacetum cinerariifolium]
MRNKTDLEDQSLDDLFNNLKIYEAEVKSSSSTVPTTQNISFVSSQNTDNTNESVSALTSVSAASTKVLVSAFPNVDNLSDAGGGELFFSCTLNNLLPLFHFRIAMSSDNAQSAVTLSSISFNLDGPSWGILLLNANELPEIDPYEESAVTLSSISFNLDGPSWGILLMNANELPEIDPYEEVAQQGQAHPLLSAYVPDPMELDEHVPVYVPEPEHPEYHAPSDDDIQALIDAFASGSSPFLLSPTSPAYDQAQLGHRAAMIRRRDDILEEDIPPRRRFALTGPPPIDIRLEIDVVRGQRTAYETELQEDSAKTGPVRVIVYGYDGLSIQPVAPPSQDYIPRPEHPPSPDYVPGPEHPPLPIEIPYPLPVDASPIATSLDYVADSDPKEDPEEDLEEDQADYRADGGDDDDVPFDDDDDDDTNDEDPKEDPFEEDDEEVEEHSAPTDSPVVPIVDLILSIGEIEALEADEPIHAPGSPISYRAAGIRIRALLPSTSRRIDIPKADMPPRKKACLTTPAPGFEIGESSAAGAARQPGPTKSDLRRCRVEQARYGITDTWDKIVDKMMEIDPTTLEGVNERVTELDTTVRQRTDEFEAMYSREACAFSMDRSLAIATHVRTLETQVAALITQTTSLQTQLTTALGRIEVLEAREPEPHEGLADAGSSC